MKKEKILKFLKYLGVACIGAFVGMGALIGVSSCTSRTKFNKSQLVKHQRVITASTELNNSDKQYYFVAKNYSSDGEGVFYQDSINLTNSAIVSFDVPSSVAVEVPFTFIRGGIVSSTRLVFTSQLDGGLYKLSRVYFYDVGDVNTYYLYNSVSQVGYFNRDMSAFIGTKFFDLTNEKVGLLNQFFDIYDLGTYAQSYDFNNAFNYNNFYQVTDTFYAQPYSPVVGVTTGDSQYVTTLSVGNFYTGGLVFNQIKVTFARNYNNSYYFETAPNSNEYLQFPTNAVGAVHYYFLQMEFVNTATNFTLMACNRTSYTKNGTPYIQFLPAWASQDYKKLEFQSSISNLKTRSIFNSLSDTEQLNEPIVTNNVGLSSAFSLLSMAFTAWLPIMNVSIVPGITIGLLLFLPLIVGIIILVIWIVKR